MHVREIGAVEEVPTFATAHDELRIRELLEMKGQRWCRNIEPLDELGRRIALRASLHEQSKDRESSLRGERPERVNRFLRFHNSNSIKF